MSLDKTTRQNFIQYLTTGVGQFGGNGDPNGVEVGGIGSEYTDFLTGDKYTKTTAFDITTGWVLGGGGGSGTVTSFSAGNLSPLFTSNVADPATTPALTFAPVSQLQNLVFASPVGGSGNPAFRTLVAADIPSLPFSQITGIVPLTQGGLGADFSAIGTGEIFIGNGVGGVTLVDLVDGASGDVQFNGGGGLLAGTGELNFDSASATLRIGASGGNTGTVALRNANGFNWNISTGTPSQTYNLDLPDSDPTVGDNLFVSAFDGTTITLGYQANGGGGGTPGGSDTELQYNDAGTFGGITGLTSDGTNLTATGDTLRATSPRIATRISDVNGLGIIRFLPVASATQSLSITNSIAQNPVTLGTNAPGVIGTGQIGTNLNFFASDAVAGNVTAGAVQGGGFLFQSGAAARLTSGTARGGDWEFRRGASIGSSTIGGGCIFPTLPRYDDNPICFRLNGGTLLRQYGMGLTDGGATLSIAAPTTLSLCVGDSAQGFSAGQVIMNNRTVVGWVSGGSNPFDFSPDVGIGRAAAKVLDFNDATFAALNGGTWRAIPTSPAQITADQNNYAPGGSSYFQRWNTDASRQITGLSLSQVTGQVHEIWNVGAQDIVIVHQSASSTAANRFLCASATNYTITPEQGVKIIYDGTTQRWRVSQLT